MTRLLYILVFFLTSTIVFGQTDSSLSIKAQIEKQLDYIILKGGKKGDTIWCNITDKQEDEIYYTTLNYFNKDEWVKNMYNIKSYKWNLKNEYYIYKEPLPTYWKDVIVIGFDTSSRYTEDCLCGEYFIITRKKVNSLTDLSNRQIKKIKKEVGSWSGHFACIDFKHFYDGGENWLYILGIK